MESARDIVIVGAGVFGVTAALELRRRGWGVTVVDRAPPPHPDASSTDVSKMIRMDYGSDRFYHELAEASMDGWDRWNAEWSRPLFHDEGFLVLAAGPMATGGFEYESYELLRARGYEPERLGGGALERRFPAWRGERYPDGYLSPRGGWAESGAVVARLVELGKAEGVRFAEGRAVGVVEDGSRAAGVRTSREASLSADHVLVCAGAWTPRLLPATGALLTSVAQPVLHFGVENPDRYRGPRFPPFAADIAASGWYGFPALDDRRLKLGHHGPGRAAEPDDRGSVGADHVGRARAFLAEALPSLAHAPVVGSRVCMYCDSRDGDLLVGDVPGHEGLTVAAGGSGHGFKFAPSLGSIIADAVEGRSNRWLSRFGWRAPSAVTREDARMLEDDRRNDP
jgi:glycine/D-amino acid oxidase-like deaminating enzyme